MESVSLALNCEEEYNQIPSQLRAVMEESVRSVALLGIVIGILIVGGAFTIASTGDPGNLIPFVQQSNNPSASTASIESWQAEQFFMLVTFLLFNLIGIGMTLAGIFYFISRQIVSTKAETETAAESGTA